MENLVNRRPELAFRKKRVLVTGHTGFKGAWLCLWLRELGATVRGYSLPPAYGGTLYEQAGLDQMIESEFADIRDLERLSKTMIDFEPEFVFHLAAQSLVRRSYEEPKLTFDTNVGGAINILEAVRRSNSVRSLVYVTSDKCYRNKEWVWGYRENDELGGSDPYSASKAASELVFSAYLESFFSYREDLGVASVRAGNVIGGGDWSPDRIVPDCIRSLRAGLPICIRNPQSTRPWQHVLEPISGYLRLSAMLRQAPKRFCGSWNFGPEGSAIYTVAELTGQVVAAWGEGHVQIESNGAAPHEASLLHLDISKARSLLGWRPRWDFFRTVGETVEWYKRVRDGRDPLEVTLCQIRQYGDVFLESATTSTASRGEWAI